MTPLEPLATALVPWQNFYLLTGTSAATLTGLMFIAVTFGASMATKATAESARAFLDPPYRHFLQIIVTACLLMIPTLGATVLGAVLIGIAAFRLGGLTWIFRQYLSAHRTHGDLEASDWVLAIVLPLVCHTLLFATGAGFLLREPLALTGLAVVVLGLLVTGIHGAWELLVWMALVVTARRQEEAGPPGPPRSAAGD